MPHENPLVVRREGGGDHGRGIPLNQHHVGSQLVQHRGQGVQGARRELNESLTCFHEIELDVGVQAERGHRLVEQFAVLLRTHDN